MDRSIFDQISPFPMTPGKFNQGNSQHQTPIQQISNRKPILNTPDNPVQIARKKLIPDPDTLKKDKEIQREFNEKWTFENALGISSRNPENPISELPKKEKIIEKSGLLGKKRVNIFPGIFEGNFKINKIDLNPINISLLNDDNLKELKEKSNEIAKKKKKTSEDGENDLLGFFIKTLSEA